ncbi:histone deacetylase family protein [Parvibaculaceae bacterium PLY_AMNH_Bact1]|nr:histone deacetylase family protein [Parvibaculaceae bacterium PLY_AMNH_Bact1]
MTTLLLSHGACLDHQTPVGHPESPARLRAVLDALSDPNFDELEREAAPRASIEDIARVHPRGFVDDLLASVPSKGVAHIDADTAMSPGSGEAALRAAGAVCRAVDAVVSGDAQNAFCAVRPPGHHAEPETSMGFCLFNNVAVGALYAREKFGLEKAAVIDFDVHHGNGTQAMFEADENLFYASTHQSPLYPGTGGASETGVGNIVNVPLEQGADRVVFRASYEKVILPALRAFDPDILFISAGFDGHADDPLAGLNLSEPDYVWVTKELMDVAQNACEGRIVSTLEGGYDLGALARSTSAHVATLMGRDV